MSAFNLIMFVGFTGSIMGGFYLMRDVRRLLETKYPEVWRDLLTRLNLDNALSHFVWKGRDKLLNDPELSQAAQRVRNLQIATIAIALVWAATSFMGNHFHRS